MWHTPPGRCFTNMHSSEHQSLILRPWPPAAQGVSWALWDCWFPEVCGRSGPWGIRETRGGPGPSHRWQCISGEGVLPFTFRPWGSHWGWKRWEKRKTSGKCWYLTGPRLGKDFWWTCGMLSLPFPNPVGQCPGVPRREWKLPELPSQACPGSSALLVVRSLLRSSGQWSGFRQSWRAEHELPCRT